MQVIGDIFQLWKTDRLMGEDVGAKADTVRKWRKFGRIPQENWDAVLAALERKGKKLTVDDLFRLNTPMKQRGRPAHKPRRKHRAEARAG